MKYKSKVVSLFSILTQEASEAMFSMDPCTYNSFTKVILIYAASSLFVRNKSVFLYIYAGDITVYIYNA